MNKNAMRGHEVFEGVDREGNVDFLDDDMAQLFKVSLSTRQSQRLQHCGKLLILHLVMVAQREREPCERDDNLPTRNNDEWQAPDIVLQRTTRTVPNIGVAVGAGNSHSQDFFNFLQEIGGINNRRGLNPTRIRLDKSEGECS